MRLWIPILFVALAVHPTVQAQDAERRVMDRVAPVYPDLAVRLHLSGIVKVRVMVARDGTAKRVEIAGGNPVLTKAAQDAVAKWKWAPSPEETEEIIQVNFHPK